MLMSHIENHALGMLITYGLIVAVAEAKALQLLPAQECLCWNSAYETTVLKAKLSYSTKLFRHHAKAETWL